METAISIIDNIELGGVQRTLSKITQFQGLVQSQLKQNVDFGIIPGTEKPTLLKPGAEKILMLMGLRSEFEIVDSTRDWETGFFQYQVRAKLYKGDALITEGLGACNTKERKYVKLDPWTMDNTVLKMSKKRALIDATLLVASLSEVFTQDIEDLDLTGTDTKTSVAASKVATDDGTLITEGQRKRMFALAKGSSEIVKAVLAKHGFDKSQAVTKAKYAEICAEIETEISDPLPFMTEGK